MIDRIRKDLTIKYTIIIANILFFGFMASYWTYRVHGINLIQRSLYDYLEEEIWEAERTARNNINTPAINKINFDITSLHNFTFWFLNKKNIHAERPNNEFIAQELEKRLTHKKYKNGKIYHENIKHKKQKWYFIVIKENFILDTGEKGEVFVLSNMTPVNKSNKTYIKISLIMAVITVLLAYLIGNIVVRHSMKYIKQSYQKQKQFVSDAAHELRTPLSILYSYTELLDYSPNKKSIIQDIKNELLQINKMIDTLLMIARYDNNHITKNNSFFHINQTIVSSVNAIKNICPSVKFILSGFEEDIPIEADQVMIKQLLYILLDNAVKYTLEDKKIFINLEKTTSKITIKIRDNGIGIKKEDLEHIFDRFWQADTSHSKKGLGLGLPLTELITNLHHGSIEVQSEYGKGTIFSISLPIK